MKRILAVFLTLAMALNIAPVAAFAAADSDAASIVVEETDENASPQLDEETVRAIASDPFLQAAYAQTEQEPTLDTSDTAMTATDDFGKMLLAEMDAQSADDAGANRILGVTVNGRTATVEYVADRAADVVVALYTDDTEQELVASGTEAVQATAGGTASSTVTVTVEGVVPSTFLVKAFLLDNTHAPLCQEFTNSLYTDELQRLQDATVEDFPEDRVLNLDDKLDTNFAVVNAETVLVTNYDLAAEENRIEEIGDGSYKIYHAEDKVQNLKVGDTFVYDGGDEGILIMRIEQVDVVGDTVTISGDDDLGMKEVFDVIKIESSETGENMKYDGTNADPMFQYDGAGYTDGSQENGWNWKDDISNDWTFRFHWGDPILEKDFDEDKKEGDTGVGNTGKDDKKNEETEELKWDGTLNIKLTSKLSYMVSLTESSITYTLNSEISGIMKISGAYELKVPLDVGSMSYEGPGIKVDYAPKLVYKSDVAATFTYSVMGTDGFTFSTRDGRPTSLKKDPVEQFNVKVTGTIYIGVEYSPSIKIGKYKLGKPHTDENFKTAVSAICGLEMGGEVNATLVDHTIDRGPDGLGNAEHAESIHECPNCISLDISFKIHVYVTFTFFEVAETGCTIVDETIHIATAYYSPLYKESGWGSCPHDLYRVYVSVLGVADVGDTKLFVTDENGKEKSLGKLKNTAKENCYYFKPGTYKFEALINGTMYTGETQIGSGAVNVVLKVPTSGSCGEDMTWELDGSTLKITGTGDMTSYGYNLRQDGTVMNTAPWSNLNNVIQTIYIDGSVASVGCYAFGNLTNVKTVRFMTRSLKTIKKGAFAGCTALTQREYAGSRKAWEKITVEEKNEPLLKAAAIYDETDADVAASGVCGDSLTWELDKAGTMTIEGSGAMYDYGIGMLGDTERAPWIDTQSKHPVKNLVVCEGVTHIGGYAFMGCTELESVEIADSVTSIGSAAFSGCESLISVSGGKNVSYIGTMAFMNCKALPAIELSNKLEGIEFSTFSGCESLQSIALPSSIEYIGMNAFKNCKNLTYVAVPGSVEFGLISNGIFEGCENLKSAAIQRGVTEIPQEMFKGCANLERIGLPDTVKTIAKDAFADCVKLKNVGYFGSEDDWEKITVEEGNEALTNAKRSYMTEKKTSGSCGSGLTWTLDDAGVLTIQGSGRMDDYSQVPWDTDKVQKVIVKNGVLSIGAYAFYDCPNLTAVQLPAGLYEIGNSAFAECPQLNSVQLPSSLTTLGDRAFRNDSGLLSINLPDSLTSIGARAFEGCRVLQSAITMPHNIVDVPRYLFYNCYKIPSVQLADGTQSIGEYAFRRCEELKSIKIPESVTSIGAGAFEWCSGLTEVVIPDGVTRIEDDTFKYSYNITSITLPENLVSIGDDAFNQTKITSMELPESVIEIGDRAFMQTELTGKFVIPSGVTEIGNGLFEWCQKLTEVVIPDGITSIGAYAFYNTGITSFVIPDGITVVSMYTFYGADLESITIPSSVTAIGDNAFDCFGLKDVYYAGSQSEWSEIKIYSGNEKLTESTIHYNYSSGGTFGGGGSGGRLSLDDDASSVENSITTGTASTSGSKLQATFADAKAGKEYVVLVSRSGSDPLNADNLIYINQITADADGELAVPFITAADAAEMTYVVACAQDGASVEPSQPGKPGGDEPSSGGGDGGGAAIILIGGVAAVAAVAGAVMLMPVKVEGTVKLADQPVANATVQVLKGDTIKAETVTDANGHFAVKVKRGGYTLRVQWTDASGQPVTRTVDFKAPDANLNVAA